jgi:hypothetical protein
MNYGVKIKKLRDVSIKYDTKKLKFGFTHEGNFTYEISACCPKGRYYIYSYCAMIHLPLLPFLDGTRKYAAI